MLALPGGAYVYQGEELGLPEVEDLPDAARQDPTFRRTGGAEPGRDGCRVPLPWSGTQPSYGFGPDAASWLPQPASWASLTVERQAADPASMLSLYREALRHRAALPALGDGTLTWLPAVEDVLAFARDPGFLCVVNAGTRPAPAPAAGRLLLASGPLGEGGALPPDTAAWYAAGSSSCE
jgi:alpha-glucosidase